MIVLAFITDCGFEGIDPSATDLAREAAWEVAPDVAAQAKVIGDAAVSDVADKTSAVFGFTLRFQCSWGPVMSGHRVCLADGTLAKLVPLVKQRAISFAASKFGRSQVVDETQVLVIGAPQ